MLREPVGKAPGTVDEAYGGRVAHAALVCPRQPRCLGPVPAASGHRTSPGKMLVVHVVAADAPAAREQRGAAV